MAPSHQPPCDTRCGAKWRRSFFWCESSSTGRLPTKTVRASLSARSSAARCFRVGFLPSSLPATPPAVASSAALSAALSAAGFFDCFGTLGDSPATTAGVPADTLAAFLLGSTSSLAVLALLPSFLAFLAFADLASPTGRPASTLGFGGWDTPSKIIVGAEPKSGMLGWTARRRAELAKL